MAQTMKFEITRHFEEERIYRGLFIGTQGNGFGEPVDSFYCCTKKDGPHYKTITTTGIMLIQSADDRRALITLYYATPSQLTRLYDGERNTPISLLNIVKRNQKQELDKKCEEFLKKELRKRGR